MTIPSLFLTAWRLFSTVSSAAPDCLLHTDQATLKNATMLFIEQFLSAFKNKENIPAIYT
jgi:hypothetical protein